MTKEVPKYGFKTRQVLILDMGKVLSKSCQISGVWIWLRLTKSGIECVILAGSNFFIGPVAESRFSPVTMVFFFARNVDFFKDFDFLAPQISFFRSRPASG